MFEGLEACEEEEEVRALGLGFLRLAGKRVVLPGAADFPEHGAKRQAQAGKTLGFRVASQPTQSTTTCGGVAAWLRERDQAALKSPEAQSRSEALKPKS